MKLMQLVDVAGPELSDIAAVAVLLGHKSICCMKTILEMWRKKLTDDEITLLMEIGKGVLVPDTKDPFPKIMITPDLKGMSLLDHHELQDLDLNTVEGKVLYQCCVKVFNRDILNGRDNTVWKENIGWCEETKTLKSVLQTTIDKGFYMVLWRLMHLFL